MNMSWFDPGIRTVEDLLGVNYSPEVYDPLHKKFPGMPIYASETASTCTARGVYADDGARGWASSYWMTDGSWKPVAERSFVAGSFVWTGFDYVGEASWPNVCCSFGIVDRCGFPKDNYYYYQSWWKTNPIVHLMPHWNWPGKNGQPIRVVAFSNCKRVELFLNGKSFGTKEPPRWEHLEWEVKYEPGTLSAKGFDANGKVTAATVVETTGAPAAIRLYADRNTIVADGEDVLPVEVDILDAQGRIVPTAGNLVTFSVRGAGFVAGVGNGNPSDHDPDQASTARLQRQVYGVDSRGRATGSHRADGFVCGAEERLTAAWGGWRKIGGNPGAARNAHEMVYRRAFRHVPSLGHLFRARRRVERQKVG